MKSFKTLLLVLSLTLGSLSFVQAQSKVAHINTTELIDAMPEAKAAQAQLEKISQDFQNDIKAMATKLDELVKKYDAEAAAQTEEENQKRMIEVQEKEQSIRQFQQQAQQDFQKKNIELYKPITEKAKAAILKVARAQGFQYVLDSTEGGTVIMAEGKNLIADVKKELGI